MIFKFLILSILFYILSASPVKQSGSRGSASDNNYQNYDTREQTQPLDLSTKNRNNNRNGPSTSEIEFACRQCEKIFQSPSGVYYHEQTHHKGRTFDCGKCPKKYTSAANLQVHDAKKHQGYRADIID